MNMELTERLISLVKQYPCLYDCRIKNYKNITKKERLWDQIAEELNQSSGSIRMKWKNLKDGYAKYKKKKNKYGNWIWGPYLDFLDGAAAMRNMPSDAPRESTNNEPREDDDDLLSTYKAEEISEDLDSSNPANNPIQEFLSLRDPLSSRVSRKRQASDDEYADDKLSLQYNSIEHKDSIDLLFESYAKSLKQMKPRTQARVKIRLAQIFADAELEDLQSETQCEIPVYSVLNTTNENQAYATSSGFDNDIKTEEISFKLKQQDNK